MSFKATCRCEEKHQGHLCVLRSKELTDEIARLTDNPKVACFMCGAEANSPDNVCAPVTIN